MNRPIPFLISIVLVAVAGIVYGIQTDRWKISNDLQVALDKLPTVPMQVAEWRGTDVNEFEAEEMNRAGIKGWVYRRYETSRDVVVVLIVCGRGGPISVHTPDVCYQGAGYRQVSDFARNEISVAPEAAAFWESKFEKSNAIVPSKLDIYWGWSEDGKTWHAPESARRTYGSSHALYKMYVIREMKSESDPDTCKAFLEAALPEFSKALSKDSP
jgi:hypothetical protein